MALQKQIVFSGDFTTHFVIKKTRVGKSDKIMVMVTNKLAFAQFTNQSS